MWAARYGHEGCVAVLLTAGAEVTQEPLTSTRVDRHSCRQRCRLLSRWRRRRPLVLVREQRVAVMDGAMARKVCKHVEV